MKVKVQADSKCIHRKKTDAMFEVDNDASENSDITNEDLNPAHTTQPQIKVTKAIKI